MNLHRGPSPPRTRGTLAEHFRRIDPRYDRQLSVEITCEGDEQIARSRNVSLGGMYLDGRKALPIGATVTLRFHIPHPTGGGRGGGRRSLGGDKSGER